MKCPLPPEFGHVHVWHFCLRTSEKEVAQLERFLSQRELDKASRFKIEAHRFRYLKCHAIKRQILSEFLGKEPQEILFDLNHAGKPFLREHENLHFNLSHTGTRGLLGVSRQAPVGVDLEEIRPIKHMGKLVKRYFNPLEISHYEKLQDCEQHKYFLKIWTQKEAQTKAKGLKLLTAIKCPNLNSNLEITSHYLGQNHVYSVAALTKH